MLEYSSDDQRSESQFSIGVVSSPSDTTITTQENSPFPKTANVKVNDLLLSMKLDPPKQSNNRMQSMEFSQAYYLKKAGKSGISMYWSTENTTTGQINGKQNVHGRIPRKPSRKIEGVVHGSKFQSKSITVYGRAASEGPAGPGNKCDKSIKPTKMTSPLKSKHEDGVALCSVALTSDGRVGSVVDGYRVETFTPKKRDKLREWERDDPDSETILDWSEDEKGNKMTQPSQGATAPLPRLGDGSGDGGDGNLNANDDHGNKDGKQGCGSGIGEVKNIAPRGKSWMIVTKRMMEEYSP
jgi:hypothetical protein